MNGSILKWEIKDFYEWKSNNNDVEQNKVATQRRWQERRHDLFLE